MRALLQRVSSASVAVDGEVVGAIERGVLVLLGVAKGDSIQSCHRLAEKTLNYRMFPDHQGRMNLSVKEIAGGLLVVSQFTLTADTGKGLRPSFTPAADPEDAQRLYQEFLAYCSSQVERVASGQFGADMKVSLCNDGPVTFLLEAGELNRKDVPKGSFTGPA